MIDRKLALADPKGGFVYDTVVGVVITNGYNSLFDVIEHWPKSPINGQFKNWEVA